MFGDKRIINKYDKYVFISPHLDDAVLSCGQLLLDLKKHQKDVKVISVFTRVVKGNISPQAKLFLKSCGYKSGTRLYKDFNCEDTKAMEYLKAECIHLNFIDAAWRFNANKTPIYKNQVSQFSGLISKEDNELIKKITNKLDKLIPKSNRVLFLGPLGVGGHADHIIIREILKNARSPKLFWEDFPYNTCRKNIKIFFSKHKKYKRLFKIRNIDFSEKEKVVRYYKSQVKSLFPLGKIPCINETYYVEGDLKLL
jgi:LmbE family N-acetylglucosaminyl deacetylase